MIQNSPWTLNISLHKLYLLETILFINSQPMREASINTSINVGDKNSVDTPNLPINQIPDLRGLNLQW